MRLHKEGFGTIATSFVVFVAINMLLHYYNLTVLLYLVSVLSAVLFGIIVYFFRFPKRKIVEREGAVISAADGKVVVIEPVEEPEYFKDKRLQISVFMSPFNVHVNWYPVGGKVKESKHHEGRFYGAYLPKSSTENERSTVVIDTEEYGEVLVRQVAGALARRIITYAKKKETVTQKEQMGFIKFGSRIDIYLPLDAEVKVKVGDIVQGSQTILAQLKNVKIS